MIVPDINLLVFAYDEGSPFHGGARRWWEGLVNGEETVGLPWAVSTGFVRIMANPRAVAVPWSPGQAISQVRQWFGHGHIRPLTPGESHLEYLERCMSVPEAGYNLTSDAHLAALALENAAVVHTHNARDFHRFPGLLWRNPLA